MLISSMFEDTSKNIGEQDQHFYGRGKLLISGEYFVLDGAKALALPVTVGQSLTVKYRPSYDPFLYWKSYDANGKKWFEAKFEFWHFDCVDENPSMDVEPVQRLLRQARKQNQHFLRDQVDVFVETRLGFPLEWGLGSSSTLLYNVAQWAYVSPFELLFNTYGGSGYDIACAQSEGPIMYERKSSGPHWTLSHFNPSFKDDLYFVYLGNKKNTKEALELYIKKRPFPPELIMSLSYITSDIEKAQTLPEFEFLVKAHEDLVAKNLGLVRAKELFFSDYWGEVKSLGAWGGDFVMVSSSHSAKETSQYFKTRGYDVFIPYRELILAPTQKASTQNGYFH